MMINRNHFNFHKASRKDIEPVTCKNEQNDQLYETGDTVKIPHYLMMRHPSPKFYCLMKITKLY